MKIIAFAASNSSASINKKLVNYAANMLADILVVKNKKNSIVSVEVLDLNDYELPIFSVDKEKELGHPQLAQDFRNKLAECDIIMISFAEHNGSYSVAYKNLFDWCSRINGKVYQNKTMLLLATSPGGRGAESVLALASNSMNHFGGIVKLSFSLSSFYDNFDMDNNKISNPLLLNKLQQELENFVTLESI
ncbi:MAG: NAD(P)H-dependent oxidoreductase [Mariprofundales bacterium]